MRTVDVQDPEDMAKAMTDFINSFHPKSKEFCDAMANEHRTLQQNFTRLCLAWLKKCDEMNKSGRYDLRNEDSVKLASKIVQAYGDEMYLRSV